MKVIALIPAAGMGKRMGAGINKQYLLLSGTPIVARTIAVFEASPLVDDIYVITPEAEIPFCREQVVAAHCFTKIRAIVPGGAERQHSVLNGLRAVRDAAADDVVLVHDGVRPFVTQEMIANSIAAAKTADGGLVAVPVKDTVKIAADGIVCGTPQRDTLWLAQTPQTFRYGIIRNAYEQAAGEGFLGTDDSSLVERLGGKVQVVVGDYRNIKITTPEDLVLAEAFLSESNQKA
ncbi:2-C-methyl-D-erythritol 4-phosphate cytidylyltransferase [Geobacter pelophilus]|uniref:2-C-methyl-D-erythritol 4-phosphate cytidylyltransferase n=1 Tax=Geoanaerobacter pelophilus TaxID=60036 RepID=A0AAW4LA62_9BACT|nr:2-C-methyl-D-erythritol 4-phosphate cytidylyltransferase [Geoanaerobacter pelophilus]MBT0665211.1 2-C-methyl-D-erythritol 4-phosphate cytidylyltransferase [Geoanaerobacter pelophilus]